MRCWPLAILVAIYSCTTREPTGSATDSWVGRWNGPEGTYLELAGANGRRIAPAFAALPPSMAVGAYEVTLKDLDAARTFNGAAVEERIEFRRDGATESIHATNGDATGMKWLAGKSSCLTIKPGEGDCRD